MRVAQYASPDEEARYGTSKIDAAIDYLEATHGKPANRRIPVDFEKLRLKTTDGSVDFPSASVLQVRGAARLAARGSTAKKPAKRNRIVDALTKKLPKQAKDVTVHYANERARLGGIPVAVFAAVLRALAAAELPAR
ncbi:MAG TPA: hypothetical protein VHB21_26720 [Minicystis sp.]|nr:hypothetical protein [Minicystis sp.]